jgi:hypothetical protein
LTFELIEFVGEMALRGAQDKPFDPFDKLRAGVAWFDGFDGFGKLTAGKLPSTILLRRIKLRVNAGRIQRDGAARRTTSRREPSP